MGDLMVAFFISPKASCRGAAFLKGSDDWNRPGGIPNSSGRCEPPRALNSVPIVPVIELPQTHAGTGTALTASTIAQARSDSPPQR